MPNTLESVIDDRRLRFGDNLRVQELDPAGAVLRETDWESIAGVQGNEICFRFQNESSTSLAVHYAFTAKNQLTLQIVKQPGVPAASAVWTLPGKILIDDINDVEYGLLDEEGSLTTRKIEISAKLDFPQGYSTLRVTFPDRTETTITGAGNRGSLKASAYHSGGDLAHDLLAFSAFTRNKVDGADELMPADIKFYGRWDLHENALVFVTHYDNTAGGKPEAYLALGGQIKGTNVGLILENGGAALQIHGRYAWNKNTLGWDLNVGYSSSTGIEARVAADAKFAGKNGTLTLKGGATLKKDTQGVALQFDLKLDYTTKDGHFVFTLTGDGQGYEVQLSGDFQIKGGKVKLLITASDKNGKKEVKGSLEYGRFDANSELKLALEAVLGPNGISLKLNMEFRFYWGPQGPVAELP